MQPPVPHSHQVPAVVCPAKATVEYGLVALSRSETEYKSGRARMMQTAAITSRFLTGCSSKGGVADSDIVASHRGLIQHLVRSHLAQNLYSKEIFLKLTNTLVRFAERAYCLRDLDALQEASKILMSLPLDAARQIGLYYHALAINRRGQTDEAKNLLETVADNAPINYRARAIQTLGGIHHDLGQLDEALRFQLEALRVASDKNANGLQARLMAGFEVATIKSLNEDHKGAFDILQGLSPLVQVVSRENPLYFYFYHNELAVEFTELGRIAEAQAACEIALAWPFAPAYPEWTATRDELEAKCTSATPSVVAINRTAEIIPAPQTQPQACLVRPKPSLIRKRFFAFCWLSSRGTFRRASVTIAGFTGVANCQTNRITLDQLGRCIKSRAPPGLA